MPGARLRTSSPGHRPRQLNDYFWLLGRYQIAGDNQIAAELGVSRNAVRRARERLGIPSRPRGFPRGWRRRTYR
jgi:hypothetical protein